MIILNLPLLDRMTMPVTGWLNKRQMKRNTKASLDQFQIVAKDGRQTVKQLSGGNQQKVVLSKWFMTDSELLILDEPTGAWILRQKQKSTKRLKK